MKAYRIFYNDKEYFIINAKNKKHAEQKVRFIYQLVNFKIVAY
jgi:hypothetical protein